MTISEASWAWNMFNWTTSKRLHLAASPEVYKRKIVPETGSDRWIWKPEVNGSACVVSWKREGVIYCCHFFVSHCETCMLPCQAQPLVTLAPHFFLESAPKSLLQAESPPVETHQKSTPPYLRITKPLPSTRFLNIRGIRPTFPTSDSQFGKAGHEGQYT